MITAAATRLEVHFFQLSIAAKEFNNSEEAMTIFPRACAIKLGVATGFIVGFVDGWTCRGGFAESR